MIGNSGAGKRRFCGGAVPRLFAITDQYTTVNLMVKVLLWSVALRIRSMSRKTTQTARSR